MPSPRWPSRAIAKRSTMTRSDEEFAVSIAAFDRRGKSRDHVVAERRHEGGDLGADGGVKRGIAHDSLLEVASAQLELRLHQRHQIGARGREPDCGRQHMLERDEAHVDHHDIGRLHAGRIERADIGFLERDDLRPVAQARMELAAADVDRIDAPLTRAGHPPVEAPTARQTWPATSMPSRLSACASLTPPRDTHGKAGSAVSLASSGIPSEALRTGRSSAVTRPAAMAAWALARLSNRPRATSRRSARSRAVIGVT